MSLLSRKCQEIRDNLAGRTKPQRAHTPKAAYKPAPFDVTAFQREANRLNVELPHIVIGRKGGKVPGIRFANRKYPYGPKHPQPIPA